MANTRPTEVTLTKGAPILIERSHNDMRNRPVSQRYMDGTITAVGPSYVSATDGSRTRRYHRDTLVEATQYSGSNTRLVTPEQRAWDVRRDAARQYLNDQGITLEGRSPWRGKEHILADLLRGADA